MRDISVDPCLSACVSWHDLGMAAYIHGYISYFVGFMDKYRSRSVSAILDATIQTNCLLYDVVSMCISHRYWCNYISAEKYTQVLYLEWPPEYLSSTRVITTSWKMSLQYIPGWLRLNDMGFDIIQPIHMSICGVDHGGKTSALVWSFSKLIRHCPS